MILQNAINVNLHKYVSTLKRSIYLLQILVQCSAVEMENMKKVTVCVEMGGKDQSAMFPKNSVLIQPALAMAPVSWESASVCLGTKERSVRKVCEVSLFMVRGCGGRGLILAFNLLTFFKVVRSSHGYEKLTVKQYCFSSTF